MPTRIIALLCIAFLSLDTANAFGPKGHAFVGEVADKILEGKPAAAKIDALVGNLTLGQAALLPDEIKSWDKSHRPSKLKSLQNAPQIQKELEAFWRANTNRGPAGEMLHHEFHYTDVRSRTLSVIGAG